MSPRTLDPDSVLRKLVSMQELLDQLRRTDPVAVDLRADAMVRHSTLWILTQLVSLGASINAHLSSALQSRAPATFADSSAAVIDLEIVDPALADQLRAACGMRKMLVHEYGEIDLDLVAATIEPATRVSTAYVQQIAAFLDDRASA